MTRLALGRNRLQLWISLLGLAALVGVSYWPTWAAMGRTWSVDTTFSHGILIIPLSLFLAWTKRDALAAVDLKPSPLGLVLLIAALCIWLLGHVVHVRLLEQIGVVGMLQALVPLVLGIGATRVLLFPLAFLWFAVPFGTELVPPLMEVTADLSVFFLKLTGVPVYRDGMLLYIPAGTYEVARACSGIKFLTAAVALGACFAYVMYNSWIKRLTFVAVAILVAILSNGVRAYLLVLIGHLTDMTFEHDRWHIVLGYVVFGAILLLLIHLGSRFQDAPVKPVASAHPASDSRRVPRSDWAWPIMGALLLLAGTTYGTSLVNSGGSAEAIARMSAPIAAAEGWEAKSGPTLWQPDFDGGAATLSAAYSSGDGIVDVFIEVFPLPGREGEEMISYANRIQGDANERLYRDRVRDPGVTPGFRLRETMVAEPLPRLVWYWYEVDGQPAISGPRAKVLEAKAVLLDEPSAQRVVVISTLLDDTDAAAARLEAFLRAHPQVLPADAHK